MFAGLEGANEGLLLIDGAGRVLGGALKDKAGTDVTDAVAAYLAGVSQEAARTAKLLGLGAWSGLAAEGKLGHVHLTPPTGEALLLVEWYGLTSEEAGQVLGIDAASIRSRVRRAREALQRRMGGNHE